MEGLLDSQESRSAKIGFDGVLDVGRFRMTRRDDDAEEVRSAHAGVHAGSESHGGRLPRLEGRRTDDR
jgi:hypothetical protein